MVTLKRSNDLPIMEQASRGALERVNADLMPLSHKLWLLGVSS